MNKIIKMSSMQEKDLQKSSPTKKINAQQTSSTQHSNNHFVASGRLNSENNSNLQEDNYDKGQTHLQERFGCQIEEMFEKSFRYQKSAGKSSWRLPNAKELFKEYYQLENLQELKIKLNQVKSKLNNYVIEDWSLHTRRQDPAGEIPWRLKTETNAEFVTVAWCKLYECLGRFPQLVKDPHMNSLHLCEAPGAFITALNHYMHSNYDDKEIKWKWLATTLNPYYEGNPTNRMIMDDRFLLYTLDNWLFHKDFTGNIIDRENLQHMQLECERRLGQVHLITADGSIDCIEKPDCQEENVALLHYAEIITALKILSEGGCFVIKMFTMYEASSVSKLFLLNCVFENVHVFKPCTSKRGNSEVYVVCINYKKQTKNLSETLDKMLLKLHLENNMLWPLFAKAFLPVDFLRQHDICCRIFMNHQINAIEHNIYSYEIRPHKTIIKRLQILRKAVSDEFYKRYNIYAIPDERKILYKFNKLKEKGLKHQIYHGSHSEREMLKETSKEEQIFKLSKYLNDVEKMLKVYAEETVIKMEFEALKSEEGSNAFLTLYRGRKVENLNSSLFVNIQLFIMRAKLNKLFSDSIKDCLWLQNPRVAFYSNETKISIDFNDFENSAVTFSQQQERFFKDLISKLLEVKPKELTFINMPFLTHFAVSILRYLSVQVYTNLRFSLDFEFNIVLTKCHRNYVANLEELNLALSSSQDQDILCVLSILELHRNDFNKAICAFNNNLLLQNFKKLLNN